MIKRLIIIITGLLLIATSTSCQKEEVSPLAGTAWECLEEGRDILIFNDSHTGVYYCKSAINDVYDEIFSSFDFVYEISEKDISIEISFSKRVAVYPLVLLDDDTMTMGIYNFKRIKHKTPTQ